MQQALTLARHALGQAWPNPAVGAVVVKDGKVIAEGATAAGGRPHAETAALDAAGAQAKGAVLYVSLEPCAHHGKTPPCTEAIIKSGIAECVIACRDPNPLVSGKGIAQLQAAGIRITEGVCGQEAREMNRGFFSVVEKKRPFIAMKIAASGDGKIAARPGVRTDITGEQAQLHAQLLRAQFDAILTGIGTVLADDPLLTVRIPGMEHRSPVRVVLDSNGRLPRDSKLRLTEEEVPVWTYKSSDDVLAELTARGITRLLIEGGQGINSYFLQRGLVDRLYLYNAPEVTLPGGLDAVAGGLDLAGWQPIDDMVAIGKDEFRVLEPCSPA